MEETSRKFLTFTNPKSAIMPAKEGGLRTRYNVQTVADAGNHMAVGSHVIELRRPGTDQREHGAMQRGRELDAVSVIADDIEGIRGQREN